jgi:RNA polymerase-binding transcription factor DksA
MADIADKTSERMEVQEAADIAEIRRKAAEMPKGVPGECERCGEPSWRLINGVCAPCRDRHKLL